MRCLFLLLAFSCILRRGRLLLISPHFLFLARPTPTPPAVVLPLREELLSQSPRRRRRPHFFICWLRELSLQMS